jgi:MoxR-like ATPase
MNRQDAVNEIYKHYRENYDMRAAVEALEFLNVRTDEIERADAVYERQNYGEPWPGSGTTAPS